MFAQADRSLAVSKLKMFEASGEKRSESGSETQGFAPRFRV